MSRKSYNYEVVDSFEETIVIPYLGIELKGWGSLVVGFIGIVAGTFVFGTPLFFILGDIGYFMSLGVSASALCFYIFYANEINNETGRNKIWEFYYISIKKYRCIYDQNGDKKYIAPKMEGVRYYNAYRKNIRTREHRLS